MDILLKMFEEVLKNRTVTTNAYYARCVQLKKYQYSIFLHLCETGRKTSKFYHPNAIYPISHTSRKKLILIIK